LSIRYQKTDAGREEIRARRLDLPRPARTLLLVIDGTRTGDEWVGMIAGVGAADLQRLVDSALVAPAAAPSGAAAPAPAEVPLEQALEAVPMRVLYDYLTAQVRSQLGLMKGYKAVLDIERCTDVAALRRYALQFVDLVRTANGDGAARAISRDLAALR
jgi:hypothetical protein